MFPPPSFYKPFDPPSFVRKPPSPTDRRPDHQNPSHYPKTHLDPSFLLPFRPSPFFDGHDLPLNHVLLHSHPMAGHDEKTILPPTNQPEEKGPARQLVKPGGGQPPVRRPRNLGAVPRRRAGKKDRHSKICTAQGIRDRRMRLSLQVARKFFDLQDMLGYDKASNTIEWLFSNSKRAIKELAKDHPKFHRVYSNNIENNNHEVSNSDVKSESLASECEVVSGLIEESILGSEVIRDNMVPFLENCERENEIPIRVFKPNSRSESREKARARARCRTREKMMLKMLGEDLLDKSNPSENDDGFRKLGFFNDSIFEGGDQETNLDNLNRVCYYENLYNSIEDEGTIEKFLGSSSGSFACRPSFENAHKSFPGYLDPNGNFMGFFGNLDLFSNESESSIHYSVENQVSLGENPSSIYSAAP